MTIGDSVIRSTGACYEKGAKGDVIEVNTETMRARIKWTEYPSGTKCEENKARTWISLKAIAKI
jgi:hypothetical protein